MRDAKDMRDVDVDRYALLLTQLTFVPTVDDIAALQLVRHPDIGARLRAAWTDPGQATRWDVVTGAATLKQFHESARYGPGFVQD
jgi:hypothetical protein